MATRTIIGNLAEDPTKAQAGQATVARLIVLENTGRYVRGEFQKDATPTRHNVEAWFDLGENAAATLRQGMSVIVVGDEHTESWGEGNERQFRRVLRATAIGPDLRFQVAQVRKVERADNGQ
ncbi:single-stranded DNA-binding protein [Curtobacterium sp. MCBD17_026]|uniref:single-stranded DNA-binding protein n=1 Tax=Curtobacterium sp. MCBD17_026 TaxID=2175621 RepID=UPI000DA8163A|nr:single-stranded DNA-binding protein [Curtobacterium sp. MCBD17_026]WIB72583.1 single-stranded DNA-binding protein [Curtobacterium sp. MCBD17_026]